MRVTHRQAIENLMAGKMGKVSVRDRIGSIVLDIPHDTPHKAWFYHHSPIVVAGIGSVFINWHGYYTSSTSERIRALCAYIGVPVPNKSPGYIKVV